MPFEIMDQRNASHFIEIYFPDERQAGFWKPNTKSDNQDKVVDSFPLEKLSTDMELPPSNLSRDQEAKLSIGWKGVTNLSEHSWNSVNYHPKSMSNLYAQPAVNLNGNSTNGNVIQHESSLFSSSFSEIFSRKLRLLGNDLSSKHATSAASRHEEEPFKSMEEVEAQTIGNLLPHEDDLFSGVIDDLGLNTHASKGDELEDFDLFSSGGGMELEGDDRVSLVPKNSDLIRVFPVLTASGCMDNRSTHVIAPVSTYVEAHRSSSFPINLASPARLAPIGKQLSFREPNHSLDEMKFTNQGLPRFHPHSVPEYHDSLDNGIPFNCSSTITDMVSSASPMMAEGLDNRYIRGARSNGHLMQPNAGVFGSSGNGSLSLNGSHYMWNNPNSHQQDPSSTMVWPNSPSFVNGIHTNRHPHNPSFSRAPPVMLNVGSPVHHHIGSAPPVNSAFWDKRHPYIGESPETSGFHLGSLGSVGFPRSSISHSVEFASPNIFSHGGGNCMDLTKSGGVHSPQQMCHLFPCRNPMISMPAPLHSPNDRVRNFSYRRNESNSGNADKKQFELDTDRIIRGEESRTTLMIKNIPNKYTSKMLLAAIDEHCRGTYDFVYLPIDFKNKCNVGYAFINMIDPQHIIPLSKAFNGKKWEKFNSEKVACIAFARIQGKAALITHFQNSSLMNEDKRCRPILFHTNGPNAGDQEPFPMGTNIRPKPRRPRTTGNNENHRQGRSSSLANTEEFSNGADSLLDSSKDSD